ncbi:hypothetical protein EXU30_19740 [Shewanella maritima]|uniref:Uncharacterized protein n=1 Tax=Shewanella maritima TaxID=2520507 RepID=A0A411PME0_9GAMM|nr:hypothetical protein [Shewanella maritima]QBF84658.1 hypothetical protein EXU30_19740 [Shewanella maritima]
MSKELTKEQAEQLDESLWFSDVQGGTRKYWLRHSHSKHSEPLPKELTTLEQYSSNTDVLQGLDETARRYIERRKV